MMNKVFPFEECCVRCVLLSFEEGLMKSIRKSEYSQPTAIQSQAVPAALSGRDIIGTFTS
jgi:superfamily II DNA/RNA helicase